MVDKDTIRQILASLMKHPNYLGEVEKYSLTINDFSSSFEKFIFSAIYNLYKDGAKTLTVVDIDNYFSTHEVAKSLFEKENGIEYLQESLDFSQEENFPFYYKRLKKFNALRDLKKDGFNISPIYEEDLFKEKAREINENFENMDIDDIFNFFKHKITKVETPYKKGDATEAVSATNGLRELLKSLEEKPDVGTPLQGNILNTISRGARLTKMYIRSCGTGVGKTRSAIGDACYGAYPVRFNNRTWKWELCGSATKTLFIGTEQEQSEIQTAIVAYLTGFNEDKILFSSYTREEEIVKEQAIEVMEYFEDNLILTRLPNPNIAQVKSVIRQACIEQDIEAVYYDYIFSSPSLLEEFRDLRIREDK